MKKLFSTIAVVALTALSLNAQDKIKEGFILYDMKIEGIPADQAAMMGDMESKTTFKNGKQLIEATSMMGTTLVLIDDKGMLMLQEQMGNKFGLKQTKEEMEKEAAKSKDKNPDPKIEYVNETKTIAGYECKKAIVTMVTKDKKEVKTEVWYSDKFEPQNNAGAKGKSAPTVKGMPFEYTMNFGAMTMKYVAKEVSTDPVADSKFELSTEGYPMKTMDELKAMQGGK